MRRKTAGQKTHKKEEQEALYFDWNDRGTSFQKKKIIPLSGEANQKREEQLALNVQKGNNGAK